MDERKLLKPTWIEEKRKKDGKEKEQCLLEERKGENCSSRLSEQFKIILLELQINRE